MIRTDWHQSLAEMERGLLECLDALDRYEHRFAGLLDEPPPVAERRRPELPPPPSERTLDEAKKQVDAVEQLLAEQAELWSKWHDSVQQWKTMVNRVPG